MTLENTFRTVKNASYTLTLLSDKQRNEILQDLAHAIDNNHAVLLAANADDLKRMDKTNPLYDRLQLTDTRLNDIANDMRHVSKLPTPLDKITKEKKLPNGLFIRRISVPFGVIGMIYEARPNVTFDVFSLCFKSGNACILKGGKDADCSNRAAVALIKQVLTAHHIDEEVIQLLPATHEATQEMLNAVGYIDLVIPRGGRKLIDFVRDNAKVPCIETGAGVVNTYIDKDADIDKATAIINNAKTRRVSVCNALDCLIVHAHQLPFLHRICSMLKTQNVTIYADERAYTALCGKYPAELLQYINPQSYGTEYMDYKLSIRTVDSIYEALDHIQKYGSGHSEAIISNDKQNILRFQRRVDAACVYVNASTAFTDGGQFGMGAEIGISTQKLGARGPMALEEITTYKWLIDGNGQIRN